VVFELFANCHVLAGFVGHKVAFTADVLAQDRHDLSN
jgi:hypothetical protein